MKFKFYYLIIFVFIVQALYFFINPKILYNPSFIEPIKVSQDNFHSISKSFSINKSKTPPEMFLIEESIRESRLYLFQDDNLKVTKHIMGISLNGNIHYSNSTYVDEETSNYYAIFTKENNKYWIYKGYLDEKTNRWRDVHKFAYEHPFFNELQDSTITIKGKEFSGIEVKELISDTYITLKSDLYRIHCTLDTYKKVLTTFFLSEDMMPDYLIALTENINRQTGVNFTPYDILKIFGFFSRRSFYIQKFGTINNPFNHKGFLSPKVLYTYDLNNDGEKEVIFLIHGYRWQNDRIICFDLKNEEILWEREIAVYAKNISIIDIDDDDIPEIIFTTSSVSHEPDLDYHFNQNEVSTPFATSLIVLNLDGTIKQANGTDLRYSETTSFSTIKYHYHKKRNEIIFSLSSLHNMNEKKLRILDLKTNMLKELDSDYEFQNIIGFYEKDGDVFFFDSKKESLTKYKIDKFNRVSKESTNNKASLYSDIFLIRKHNQEMFLTLPISFFDYNLKLLYESKILPNALHWELVNDYLFFMTEYLDEALGKTISLKTLYLKKNVIYNYNILIIIALQIALLMIYLYFKAMITIPVKSKIQSHSILIIWMNRLYSWSLYGNAKKYYTLNKKISYHKSDFFKSIAIISNYNRLYYYKNYLLIKIEVYEIESLDEYLIFNTLAHDLKNDIVGLSLKIQMLLPVTYEIETQQRQALQLKKKLNKTIEKLTLLTNFSQVNLLSIESINISILLESIMIESKQYHHFNSIEFCNSEKNLIIEADKMLISMALKNLINNAIEACRDKNSHLVKIKVSHNEDFIIIYITNTGTLLQEEIKKIISSKYSQKENGSGLGVLISKRIIEKHQGNFRLKSENNQITVVITLPKIQPNNIF